MNCIVRAAHKEDRPATHKIRMQRIPGRRLAIGMVCCQDCGEAVSRRNKAWELLPLQPRLPIELPKLGG